MQPTTSHQPKQKRNRTAPNGFYWAVMKYLGNVKCSKQTVSAVRKGKRKNDAVLMAIIQADHNWQKDHKF